MSRATAKVSPKLLREDDQEEEQGVLRRGRNAKANHNAKNASVGEYKHATGLEVLFGYLYLTGQIDRLEEIFNYIITVL